MRSDRKIIALRAKFGLEWYAIRCMLLETLAGAENFEIHYSPMEIELLAWDFGIDADLFNDIVHYMAKINLLLLSGQSLTCPKLIERLEPLLNKRKRYRDKSEGVLDNQNEVLETETPVSEEKTPQSKVKHSKGKKRKHSRAFVRAWATSLNLTSEQKKELTDTYGDSIVKKYEKKLLNYITSKWDPYDSHFHTLLVRFDKDNIKPKHKSQVMRVEITPMDSTQRAHVREWLMHAKKRLLWKVSA